MLLCVPQQHAMHSCCCELTYSNSKVQVPNGFRTASAEASAAVCSRCLPGSMRCLAALLVTPISTRRKLHFVACSLSAVALPASGGCGLILFQRILLLLVLLSFIVHRVHPLISGVCQPAQIHFPGTCRHGHQIKVLQAQSTAFILVLKQENILAFWS